MLHKPFLTEPASSGNSTERDAMNYNTNPPAPQLQTGQSNAQQGMRSPQMPPMSGGVNSILGSWQQQRRDLLNRPVQTADVAAYPAKNDAMAQMQTKPQFGIDPMQQEYAMKPAQQENVPTDLAMKYRNYYGQKQPGNYGIEPMQPSPGELTPIDPQTDALYGAMPRQISDSANPFQQAQGFAPNPNSRPMNEFGPPNGSTFLNRPAWAGAAAQQNRQQSGFGPPNSDPYARMAQNPRVMALMQMLRQRQGSANNLGNDGEFGLTPIDLT